MPYKDKEQAKQASKERMRKHRQGVTSAGRNTQGVTLHPAIIRTINRLTTNPDGSVDHMARTNRMAMAINYERMFPGRPYTGTGL